MIDWNIMTHEEVAEGRAVGGAALQDHPCCGPHGQTPVLNFVKLKLGKFGRLVLQLERVNPEVSWRAFTRLLAKRSRDSGDDY